MKHIWDKFIVLATGCALSLVAIGAKPAEAANIIQNGWRVVHEDRPPRQSQDSYTAKDTATFYPKI